VFFWLNGYCFPTYPLYLLVYSTSTIVWGDMCVFVREREKEMIVVLYISWIFRLSEVIYYYFTYFFCSLSLSTFGLYTDLILCLLIFFSLDGMWGFCFTFFSYIPCLFCKFWLVVAQFGFDSYINQGSSREELVLYI
jgi:hypothetical protein